MTRVEFKNFFFEKNNNIILVLIMLIGIFFRFHGLINQGGLIIGDEEVFLGIARSIKGSVIFVYHLIMGGFNLDGLRESAMGFFGGGFRIGTISRPGYIFLITLPVLIFGAHDYIPLIVNASLSAACIYLVFWVAKEITKRKEIGLISAALYSLSGYAIFWARSGLAQTTTSFFLILGIQLYLYSLRDANSKKAIYFKLSAVIFGFLFTTHYNTWIFLAIIFCFDFFYAIKRKEPFKRTKDAVIFFLSPILIFEIISLIYAIVLKKLGYRSGGATYFSEIIDPIKHMSDYIPAYAHSYSFWRYFEYIIAHDNIILVVLLALFIPIFIYRKWHQDKNYLLLALIFYFPLLFYSSVKLKTEYTFVVFLPLFFVVCGISVWSVANIFKNKIIKNIILISLMAFLIFFGFQKSIIFSSFKNHYEDAANYLKQQGKITELCGTRNGVENTKFFLNDFSIKSQDSDCTNSQYAILDWQMAYFPHIHSELDFIAKENQPVLVFEQPYSDYMCPRLRWEDDIGRCREDSLLRVYKMK